jgi:hypothetical protein
MIDRYSELMDRIAELFGGISRREVVGVFKRVVDDPGIALAARYLSERADALAKETGGPRDFLERLVLACVLVNMKDHEQADPQRSPKKQTLS